MSCNIIAAFSVVGLDCVQDPPGRCLMMSADNPCALCGGWRGGGALYISAPLSLLIICFALIHPPLALSDNPPTHTWAITVMCAVCPWMSCACVSMCHQMKELAGGE